MAWLRQRVGYHGELVCLRRLSSLISTQFHIGVSGQPPQLPSTNELSELGIDFIKQCLTIDPKKRPTVDELLEHPWIEKFREEIELEYEDEIVHQHSSHKDNTEKDSNTSAQASASRSSFDGSPSLDTPSFEQ